MKKTFVLFLFLSINMLFAQQSDRFNVKNLSVNSKNNEFGTILTNDGSILYLLSNFKNSNNFNEKAANLFKSTLRSQGEFSKGRKFPTDAIHAVFTSDGSIVYFSKKIGDNFQLYTAQIDRTGRWKNTVKLPFNKPNYTFKQPALNLDNTKLFFVSDMPGSNGETDIYFVTISNHGLDFSKPIKLGVNVNSGGVEIFPFLGKDDKLYFSSNNVSSMGGLDIFESFYENGKYVKTSNLGAPINSVKDDFAYILIADSNKGYFSSNRTNGMGGVDIYYFKDSKPFINKCAGSIKGAVKDKHTKKAIFEASVEVFSPQDHMGTVLTNFKGEFTINNIECSERYDVVCYKEGYNGFAELQTIPDEGKQLILYLDPEFPEGFEEEFDFSSEMVVYDTQTNEIIASDINNQLEEDSGLSFAEKRDLARLEKEAIKKKRIEEEKKAERIEAQRKEEARIAALEAKSIAVKKEKEARLAYAKKVAEDLRKEKELAEREEKERIEAEIIAQEKAKAEQQRIKELTAQKEKEAELEAERLAQIEKDKQLQIETERLAEEKREKERIEAERIEAITAQKQAIKEERQKRIAQARATAEKIKLEEEAIERAEKQKKEIVAQKNAETEQQHEKELAIQQAKEEESERLAQIENEKKSQIEAEQLAEEKKVNDRIEAERYKVYIAQKEAIEKERLERIRKAQATAKKLRLQKERAEKANNQKIEVETIAQENAKVEQQHISQEVKEEEIEVERLAQIETEQLVNKKTIEERLIAERNIIIDAQRKAIEEERQERIAQARATAEKLRQENIITEKELETKQIEIKKIKEEKHHVEQIILQKEEEIAVALNKKDKERINNEKIIAQIKVKKIQEEIVKQSIIERQKKAIEKDRQIRIAQAEALAKKILLENETAKKAETKRIENQKIAQEKAKTEQKRLNELALQKAKEEEIEKLAQIENEKQLQINTEKLSQSNNEQQNLERCSKNINGIIQNSISNEPIVNATIDIYYDGQNLESITTNGKGEFYFYNVDCNTKYTLICFKKDYNNIAKADINTDQLPNQIVLLLEPNPKDIKEEEIVVEEKPIIEEITKEEFLVERIETVEPISDNTVLEKINEREVVENVIREPTGIIEEKTKKIPKIEIPKIIGKKIQINPIYFELDEWYLTLSARRELDKIIVIMSQNTTMIIETGSHTDTRGPFDYNLELSEKRSQEAVGYLIANGVDPDRISGRGYGETMPVNHCLDGVRCTDREHLENRRTEFVILKQ